MSSRSYETRNSHGLRGSDPLAERVLDLAHEAALLRLHFRAEGLGQAAKEFLLVLVEILRRDDVCADDHVAAAAATKMRHALAANDENFARLGARGHAKLMCVAIDRGNLDFVAERHLREVEVEVEDKVVLIA